MGASHEYEFSYISRKEQIKLFVAKFTCLAFAALSLISIIFLDMETGRQLHFAGGALAALGFYLNLFRVRTEVIEIFEPPYQAHGHGLAILCVTFIIAGFYLDLSGR